MVGRLVVAVLIGPVSALAAIGALTLPGDVLFGWILGGAGAGILGASRLRRRRDAASGPDLPVAAAAAAVLACLVLAGLLATLGSALTATVLALVVAGGLGAGYHHRVAPSTAPESHDGSVPCRPSRWPAWPPRTCPWLGGAVISCCSSPSNDGTAAGSSAGSTAAPGPAAIPART